MSALEPDGTVTLNRKVTALVDGLIEYAQKAVVDAMPPTQYRPVVGSTAPARKELMPVLNPVSATAASPAPLLSR